MSVSGKDGTDAQLGLTLLRVRLSGDVRHRPIDGGVKSGE